MKGYEGECAEDNFYCGYLTIIDFLIYEVMNYMRLLFPNEMAKYPKLELLRKKVGEIPEIETFEGSERTVKEFCPVRYFKRFKRERIIAQEVRFKFVDNEESG